MFYFGQFERTPDPELPGHLLLEQYQVCRQNYCTLYLLVSIKCQGPTLVSLELKVIP